ncbi:kinase-like domain-containing protein [Pisolithus croceorrhizus]|nr:kinase-like domain-containing protein [Pisolithus croceorrhizus]KAI6110898.1 kinase-like domain-containing protein [Pisolithus croceorrhizus]KAI6147623.1 kinase-like domain-containing protein [Pisolithus thermaeus]
MDPRRSYPSPNQNSLVSRRDRGGVSVDARNHEMAERALHSLRIHPSMPNRDQERGPTNQDVRQRENDGRFRQPPQPPITNSPRNPGYDASRSVHQQVRSPAESYREQTAPPWNPEASREGEPPTPRRERAVDAQGLDNWHHDTLRSLPQATQPPRSVHVSASGGNSSRGMSMNVSFSGMPPDLTAFVQKTGHYADRSGGYADVWRCTFYRRGASEGGEMVAVKCIRLMGELSQQEIDKVIKRLQGEVHLWWMRLTPHKHVLPFYGIVKEFGHLPALVSPWAENGTLTSYLDRNRRHLSDDRKLIIILQVTSGLQHLHTSNICHGDLTGSNILIDRNENVLISDFGLSSIVAEFNHTSYFKSCRPGAVRWADPQLFIDTMERNDGSWPEADMKNDIYSMGCIILQVATGMIPYHDMRSDLAVQLAKCNGRNPIIPPTVSPTLANLMGGCWDSDRRLRPRLGEIRGAIQKELDSLQT